MPAMTTLSIRATANRWISDNFPEQRKFLSHTSPVADHDGLWRVELVVRNGKQSAPLGQLIVRDGGVILVGDSTDSIAARIRDYIGREKHPKDLVPQIGEYHDFRFADGIEGAAQLEDQSVDLLLTDPPYGISKAYTCEKQVPRRLRKNGTDFIMPKGHFGSWDDSFPTPSEWTAKVLPKIRGWAVIFCAQAQIGAYSEILESHRFVAVGTLVWQKTNPVPFNHTHKPINAWEASVVGKRPGTKFNGRVVHNVFRYKSPSPQERIHPTQKPLGLISEYAELFCSEGDLILDPFAGSATTVVAAIRSRRRVLAFENDPASFEAATARVANLGKFP